MKTFFSVKTYNIQNESSVEHLGKNIKELSNFILIYITDHPQGLHLFIPVLTDIGLELVCTGNLNVCAFLELVGKACFLSSQLQPDFAL